jgi:hypothetical protein
MIAGERRRDVELLRRLNSPNILPQRAYRRNVRIYELVCYVNCMIVPLVTGPLFGALLCCVGIKRVRHSATRVDGMLPCASAQHCSAQLFTTG